MSWHRHRLRERIGFVAGPVAFLVGYLFNPFALEPAAASVLATTAWVVLWWVSEAVPIPVASLLPIVLFPATGAMTVSTTTAPYADPIIFLLLGGFLLALAVERWHLHHRIALETIRIVGTSGRAIVFGFMVATAVLSMWISNTATAMMMVPIGGAVILELSTLGGRRQPVVERVDIVDPREKDGDGLLHHTEIEPSELPNTAFGLALMLAIAYGASVGGAATLIGSPPNAVLAGVASANLGIEIGFLEWMLAGVPLAALFLLITWGVLVVTLRPTVDRQPGREGVIREQLDALGPMTVGERRVLLVFALVAGGWILRPFVLEAIFPLITDAVIAIIGGILVFMIPVKGERMLEWEHTKRVPWGVLLLLGAGFSIARAFQESGLDAVIATAIADLGITDLLVMIALITTVVILLTNVTSNTATAALFMPITISIGLAVGVDPLTLMASAAFAASFAFILPVATAPNAIVFGTGYMTIPEMARVGLVLTLPAIVAIVLVAYLWIPFVWS